LAAGAAGWGFDLVRRVGEGASSVVWQGVDRATGRLVALKIGRSTSERSRLASEAERLCAVQSPHLSTLVGAGIVPESLRVSHPQLAGQPFVALSWCEGSPLDTAVLPAGESLTVALAVARDVGQGLADLHATGFAHGDIKPANLIVQRSEPAATSQVHLIDLGLANAIASETVSGATPRYLAPEALQPGRGSTAQARDLWALGLTLAEIAIPAVRERGSIDPATLDVSSLPAAFASLIRALLSPLPAARPAAHWVSTLARSLLAEPLDDVARGARWQRAVQQSYLAVRHAELLRAAQTGEPHIAVQGVAGDWLREAATRLCALANLRRGRSEVNASPRPIEDLSPFAQRRWLVNLIGASAAHFPELPRLGDDRLAERLLQLAQRRDPRAFTFTDLVGDSDVPALRPDAQDRIALVAQLSAGSCSRLVLDVALGALQQAPQSESFRSVVADAFKRSGEYATALLLFDQVAQPAAQAEAAETLRLMGDRPAAQQRLQLLQAQPLPLAVASRCAATQARLQFDRGEPDAARSTLRAAPESAATHEVAALLDLHSQQFESAKGHAEAAVRLAANSEASARAQSVLGSVQHAVGDSTAALAAFQRAAEHAVHAGALLQEATYVSNVAAAAADLGQLTDAVEFGQRGLLLLEHLGRVQDCGRVALSVLHAYVTVGAVAEAQRWYDEVQRRARANRDDQCQACAHLAMAELLLGVSDDAGEHAQRAMTLLERGSDADRLRALSQLLLTGQVVVLAEGDGLARSSSASDAKLQWWGARAAHEARQPAANPQLAQTILAELNALATLPVAPRHKAPPLAQATQLAMRLNEGDWARRFMQVGVDALRQIERGTPAVHRAAFLQLPWVQQLQEPPQTALAGEQIGHLEHLVRSLGVRDRLRPLLDQVLDALVLWTGVERGLVLLRAPGGRLVPRAARNLARSDITGEQLKLSQSLAERALHSGEPVVAIDASYEISELHHSVHALGLRSVLAVPLIARGEALGVVYLDDRTRRGAFGKRELSWVRLVATLAAVAIADARDQLLLRRAARSARHAKERVLQLLTQREAQVDQLQRELAQHNERGTRFGYASIVGGSEPLRSTLRLVDRVANAEISVLILGESGSGKELIARAIHENGPRANLPFVTENCAAIPETLLESTLFGHVKGAFTGASRGHTGLFELAHRGTLFLDEVGEMSLGMQAKLLRAIDSGEIRPVGSERSRSVDVRVLCATHRNLEQMVTAGTFRKDLFYRLNVIAIPVPPLRERSDDIEPLMAHFFHRHGPGRALQLSPEARRALFGYAWPGNVRELENEVRRLLILTEGRIELDHLSPAIAAAAGAKQPRHEWDLRGRLDALESSLVLKALERTQGNQTRAAELLGVSRFGLQKMMKRLEIDSLRAGREAAAGLTDAQ
jgi:transcriptional regulator with GAF, ATPase, and Fis domain/serine/threonine protein kinase/tetratricopeptide (TPR) repeat protein